MTTAVRRVLMWPVEQVRSFLGNLAGLFSGTESEDLLPPWILSTLAWIRTQFGKAAGYGSPQEQIVSSLVLGVAMIVSSLGVLTPLAVVMLVPMMIGVWRLYPAVDDRWPLSS